MHLLESNLKIDKTNPVAVYLQAANSIISFIRQGMLRPGVALPGSRVLAKALGVHRKTVIAAYDELDAQGYTEAFPRKGIFVAAHLPDVSSRKITTGINAGLPAATFFKVDNRLESPRLFRKNQPCTLVFNDGFPDTRLAPVELLVREYRRFAAYKFTDKYLMYGPEKGSENLRNEMARFLADTRGLKAGPEDIIITKGAQMALYLCAQVLLSKGDIVVAGDPGYSGANEIFEHAGAKLDLVPVDEEGIDVDAIEKLCRRKKIRMVYVIPHHHTPTTVTLSPQRRMRLHELSVQHRFAIIEDDYDFDFHYASSPVLPLASADNDGTVIYIGSFCKTIAPGIRIGFMIAPKNLIDQATRLRRLIDRQGEHLLEEAMANLLKNGDIGRHLKKTNKIYHERRDILCALLTERLNGYIDFKVPDGGFAVWVRYLRGIDPAKIAQRSLAVGLTVSDGNDYYYRGKKNNRCIRLGFASLNEKELRAAVTILEKAVKK